MELPEDPIDPLAALAGGDSGPFEAFVHQQTPLFLAYFRRLGARSADAEDLTQDVMLRLFRHAESYQGQGRLEGFAFRIARNAWIDFCRRASNRRNAWDAGPDGDNEFPAPESSELAPDRAMANAEERDSLFAAIATLGPTHREAFRLGVVEQTPYSEISEQLGIPVGTVKSRVFHAVQKLRARLSVSAAESEIESHSGTSIQRAGEIQDGNSRQGGQGA